MHASALPYFYLAVTCRRGTIVLADALCLILHPVHVTERYIRRDQHQTRLG